MRALIYPTVPHASATSPRQSAYIGACAARHVKHEGVALPAQQAYGIHRDFAAFELHVLSAAGKLVGSDAAHRNCRIGGRSLHYFPRKRLAGTSHLFLRRHQPRGLGDCAVGVQRVRGFAEGEKCAVALYLVGKKIEQPCGFATATGKTPLAPGFQRAKVPRFFAQHTLYAHHHVACRCAYRFEYVNKSVHLQRQYRRRALSFR